MYPVRRGQDKEPGLSGHRTAELTNPAAGLLWHFLWCGIIHFCYGLGHLGVFICPTKMSRFKKELYENWILTKTFGFNLHENPMKERFLMFCFLWYHIYNPIWSTANSQFLNGQIINIFLWTLIIYIWPLIFPYENELLKTTISTFCMMLRDIL